MVEIIDSFSIGSLLSEGIYSFFSINEKVFMGIGSTLTMYGLYRQFIIGEEQAMQIFVQKEDLDLRNHVANIFLKNSGEEMYAKVLGVILRATGSKYGIFGFINENGSWECPSMTRDIWSECQMPNKSMILPQESWGGGLWGKALRTKSTQLSNEKFNVPKEHIAIKNALDVPIVYDKRLIGNLVIGNKQTDYNKNDQELMETIADYISPILDARLKFNREEKKRTKAEHELRKARDSLVDKVKIATAKIVEEKEIIETIIQTTPNAIIVLDTNGNKIKSNKAFEELFFSIFHKEIEPDFNILNQKKEHPFFTIIKDLVKSKSTIPQLLEPTKGLILQIVNAKISILNEPFGDVIELIDVSHFVEFENIQRKFITTVSHELRTPVTSIDLSIKNFLKYGSKMTLEQQKYLFNSISENTTQLSGIIKNAIYFSKVTAKDFQIEIRTFNLSEMINYVLAQLNQKMREKKLTIKTFIEEGIQFNGDSNKIQHVLQIIIHNAIKFSYKDSSLNIQVKNYNNGEYNPDNIPGILIQVSDSGLGIKKEDQEKIFEQFYKTDETRDIQGIGLGLAVAKNIIRLHKGEIYVKSKVGKGSTFSIFLPYLKVEKQNPRC